ncbi:hypothetical protein BDR05DRAFT_1005587 [Suillus weaverae]|nr:hypothetical protein BDR05DRAFT_1005587 [Suillus weaverae]
MRELTNLDLLCQTFGSDANAELARRAVKKNVKSNLMTLNAFFVVSTNSSVSRTTLKGSQSFVVCGKAGKEAIGQRAISAYIRPDIGERCRVTPPEDTSDTLAVCGKGRGTGRASVVGKQMLQAPLLKIRKHAHFKYSNQRFQDDTIGVDEAGFVLQVWEEDITSGSQQLMIGVSNSSFCDVIIAVWCAAVADSCGAVCIAKRMKSSSLSICAWSYGYEYSGLMRGNTRDSEGDGVSFVPFSDGESIGGSASRGSEVEDSADTVDARGDNAHDVRDTVKTLRIQKLEFKRDRKLAREEFRERTNLVYELREKGERVIRGNVQPQAKCGLRGWFEDSCEGWAVEEAVGMWKESGNMTKERVRGKVEGDVGENDPDAPRKRRKVEAEMKV